MLTVSCLKSEMFEKDDDAMDISSIGLRTGFSQAQVTKNQLYEFTKDGKKIVKETSASGVVSVKIDPEGEKVDAERTKKLREIMQKVYAGTKLNESELAFLRSNYPDTYQSVVEKYEEIFENKNDKCQSVGDVQNPELIELLKKGDLYV